MEEQAPLLPPKPKYLTNRRLKMFQNGHRHNGSGNSGRGVSLYGVTESKEGVANGTYGRLPARPYAQKETGVSLVIPTGAIPHGVRQEAYFKVCREDSILSTLDREKGKGLLSPCVLCGPSGLTFTKPLESKLPHSGSSRDSPSCGIHSLKGLLTKANVLTERDQISQSKQASKMRVSSGSASVYVDRF